ncbi:MAG: ankyrin repeat domain-containing protein [Alphaproteobacteria bacterium]|nr:ankyrin repeat domain-containing protein [Alphaproteobacteria bacterium]
MKKIFYLSFVGLFLLSAPSVAAPATPQTTGFAMASQLLSAARNGNTRLVQNLINSGADVNYIDSTGLSVVCTAIMNNDMRAVQILQMYGADASECDRQIKNYRTRNNTAEETGLFAGLSPTHKLVLGVLGTGAVVAGLLWLTDAFDSDNHNSYSVSGSHSNNSGGHNSNGTLQPAFTLPNGPAMVTSTGAVSTTFNYDTELNKYATDYATNFTYMNATDGGNYLLMMHGYAPFARGYMGQATLRTSANAPVPSSLYGQYKLGNTPVSGGIPLNVALITANGINNRTTVTAGVETGIHDVDLVDSLQDRFFVWTTMRNTSNITDINSASNQMVSTKYFNNQLNLGGQDSSLADDEVVELDGFDFSGNDSAIHNTATTDSDNILAKIVGGNTSGAGTGDYTGFMPNGQLTIYRTGGGASTSGTVAYYNYRALRDAVERGFFVVNPTTSVTDILSNNTYSGRAKIGVVANLDVIEPLHAADVTTVGDVLSASQFYEQINTYYSNNVVTSPDGYTNTPSQDAQYFFSRLGTQIYPLTVFSTGASLTDDSWSGRPKDATFENAVPLVVDNARNLFMSVVAVNLPSGTTSSATNISGFTPNQKYQLAQWGDGVNYYKARACGVAGTGTNAVDPWCFAAAGLTDEQATAAAAGAAGVVKSAFTYLSNQNVFALLALTADGAYLGTNPSTGKAWGTSADEATNALVNYLDSMYKLPDEYQADVTNGTMTYLEAFKRVFGYGLINLERATTPGNSIYYYSNGKILSTSGNAYWRAAALSKMYGSSVFGARNASIPVSFYDVLTSADGELSLPRVWNMNMEIANDSSHGLYMGDTLAELKTHDTTNTFTMGDLQFGLARSERAYDDNMNGLDNLSVAYNGETFGFSSSYQHYLTDGAGRFTGLANPVLSLTSNAVTSGFSMRSGRMSLVGRGFVADITNEALLENDPAISNNFAAAKLSDATGAETGLRFDSENLSIASNVGTMHESKTVLGALGNGLFDMHGADTNYVDAVVSYAFTPDIDLTLRGTYAWTRAGDVANGVITGMSELKSNAFAAGLRFGNFDFAASMPLALVNGGLRYSYADFSVDDNGQLVVNNLGERSLDLTPESREYRFNASYRHKFGEWTDGALGFIYRVNPNNTRDFGNESIFMFKMSHRLGI